ELPSKKQSCLQASTLSPEIPVPKLPSSLSQAPVHSGSAPSINPSPSLSMPSLQADGLTGQPALAEPPAPAVPPPAPPPAPPAVPPPPPAVPPAPPPAPPALFPPAPPPGLAMPSLFEWQAAINRNAPAARIRPAGVFVIRASTIELSAGYLSGRR